MEGPGELKPKGCLTGWPSSTSSNVLPSWARLSHVPLLSSVSFWGWGYGDGSRAELIILPLGNIPILFMQVTSSIFLICPKFVPCYLRSVRRGKTSPNQMWLWVFGWCVIQLLDLQKKGIGKKFQFVLDTVFGTKQFNELWHSRISGINAVWKEKRCFLSG